MCVPLSCLRDRTYALGPQADESKRKQGVEQQMRLREQLLKTGEVQRQLMKLQNELAGEIWLRLNTARQRQASLRRFPDCLRALKAFFASRSAVFLVLRPA